MEIETEILKFWQWAEKSPSEYAKNRGSGEWESLYPGWSDLQKAIDSAIEKLNDEFDLKLAELIIQALAIDNDSELVLDKIEDDLRNKKEFIYLGIKSNQPEARWQIAELLSRINLEEREEILTNLIYNDQDNYVKRRALLSLNLIDPSKAVELARQLINHKDEYLKMVSTKILNGTINN